MYTFSLSFFSFFSFMNTILLFTLFIFCSIIIFHSISQSRIPKLDFHFIIYFQLFPLLCFLLLCSFCIRLASVSSVCLSVCLFCLSVCRLCFYFCHCFGVWVAVYLWVFDFNYNTNLLSTEHSVWLSVSLPDCLSVCVFVSYAALFDKTLISPQKNKTIQIAVAPGTCPHLACPRPAHLLACSCTEYLALCRNLNRYMAAITTADIINSFMSALNFWLSIVYDKLPLRYLSPPPVPLPLAGPKVNQFQLV